MGEVEAKDVEPRGVKHINPSEQKGTQKALENIQRNLTQEDLDSPGTQKMILAELERLQEANKDLEEFRDKYHGADKERDVLKEKLNSNKADEILYSASLTMSSAIFGISFSITEDTKWIVAIMSGVMFLGAVIYKCVKK